MDYRKELEELIENQCRTSKRDSSHDAEHSKRVATYCENIAKSEGSSEKDIKFCVILALLHDYADIKYDKTGKFRRELYDILLKYFNEEDTKLAINIIDRAGFTHEFTHGDADWKETLGDRGIMYRNILSDGDKLDAYDSKYAISRCASYASAKLEKPIDSKEVRGHVIQHFYFKILKLPQYIRTKSGKELVAKYIKETEESFAKYLKS